MKKERKSENFLPKPIYPGGPRKLSLFIKENLKYPEDAIEEKVSGTVRIKVEIDYRGTVIGSKVLSGLTKSCNEEAKRLVKLLKFEVEQKLRKGKIRFSKTLNIKFVPPAEKKPKTTSTQGVINYHITKTKVNKQEKPVATKSNTYEYVIKF